MTLNELIVATNLNGVVAIPRVIGFIKIENPGAFCRLKELNYLRSIDFKDDLIEILSNLLESSIPLNNFSLIFVQTENEKLKLEISKFEESL